MMDIAIYWQQLTLFLGFDPSRLMAPDILWRLVFQVALLFGSAFFSSAETALFSLSDVDMEQLRRKRHPRADLIHDLLGQPRRLIISILCGNELINIAATANLTGLLIILYGPSDAGWISLVVMVPLLLLFGEITPKTIAVTYPVQVSTKITSGPLSFWVRIITPFRWAIRIISDQITTWIVGAERDADHLLRMSEFRSLVVEIEEQGLLSATDRVLIYNLLDAGNIAIEYIMTPRTQIHFIDARATLAQGMASLVEFKKLRMPVYEGNRDNVLGFLHMEDVLEISDDRSNTLAGSGLIRPCRQVPVTKTIDETLDFFQFEDERAAMVIDEFGGVAGIITLEDILSFIFGEIAGDFIDPKSYTKEDENVFVVSGDMKLTDFEALTNFGIEDERMTTIGGVVLRHLGKLPGAKDTVVVENIKITVLEMDGNRIARIRVEKSGDLSEMTASDVNTDDAATKAMTKENREA